MKNALLLSSGKAAFIFMILSGVECSAQYQSGHGTVFAQSANGYSNSCGSNANGISWANPSRAQFSDLQFATAAMATTSGEQTEYLTATGFGFSIPLSATIDGITVCVQGYSSLGSFSINKVQPIKANVITGTSQNTPQSLTSSDSWYTFGSCTNLFGTSLTPSDVNNAGFGAAISVNTACCNVCAWGLSTIYINAIFVIVYYNGNCSAVACSAVLPINLVSWSAQPQPGKVDLLWSTATEVNNSFFTVEKSADGKDFEAAGRIAGAGNSSHTIYYSLTDENPFIGTSYYRLKQTDFDGHFTYSPIIATYVSLGAEQVQVYPNPVTNNLYFDLSNSSSSLPTIRVFDIAGRMVMTPPVQSIGMGRFEINTGTLQRGLYIIEIADVNGKVTRGNFIKN